MNKQEKDIVIFGLCMVLIIGLGVLSLKSELLPMLGGGENRVEKEDDGMSDMAGFLLQSFFDFAVFDISDKFGINFENNSDNEDAEGDGGFSFEEFWQRYGFDNKKPRIIERSEYNDDLFVAKKGDKYGVINSKGEVLIDFKYPKSPISLPNDMFAVPVEKTN